MPTSPHTFELVIMLPKATYPPRRIISLDVPATDGRMTILARHQSMLVAIVEGELIIKPDTTNAPPTVEHWHVGEGAVLIQPNKVVLTTTSAKLHSHHDGIDALRP